VVCKGFTSGRSDGEITELSPLRVDGRVVYAAPFDPGLERPSLGPAAERALTLAPSPSPSRQLPSEPPTAPDSRLFFIGIAAGVIAALALGQHSSQS
jgi:hypothetical protein